MFTPIASVALGILFVAIAGTNVWLMLRASSTSQSPNRRANFLRLHRLGGYLFLGLFSVMFFYMNLRVFGVKHQLPLAVTLHTALAFLLVPLLLVKVLIARHYKHYSGTLLALGVTIFVSSFLLVSVTAFPVLWSAVRIDHVPIPFWISFIAVVLLVSGTLFFRRPASALPGLAGEGVRIGGESVGKAVPASATEAKKSLLLLLSRTQEQTHDSKTLRFLLPQGNGFHPRPGQFLTFNWILDGKRIARSYSICSSPLQKGYLEITVKRTEHGCVSTFLNERANVGLTVEAWGPSGQFCFDESQHQRVILIAGGSGITPMMSMLRYIDDLGLTTDVTLLYFIKTPRDIMFANELAQLRGSIRTFRYLVVPTRADSNWKGPSGHLTQELLTRELTHLDSSVFFLCGPAGLMESARNILHSLDVPNTRILQESFGAQPGSSLRASSTNSVATVVFARSRRSCVVPEGTTVLETAEANGIPLPSGCRQGQCGTCAVRALSGVVRMDTDAGLRPDLKESGYVLACVGRPEGTVTVDF
jgi:glycine betaine catabolism B